MNWKKRLFASLLGGFFWTAYNIYGVVKVYGTFTLKLVFTSWTGWFQILTMFATGLVLTLAAVWLTDMLFKEAR